ncbi:MAG: beta-tubulin [Hyphomicrobiales bacterium]|nr:beta-tubulin [Hyphomicrobiales bacterium]
MRAISPETQARLDDGAATFCHCWKLVRRDGLAQGFTNHDADLAFDGVSYDADAGLDAAKMDAQLGLAPGAMDVAGALNSASLSETDLANGVYDGASVEIWLVDWREPTHRILLDAATLGEVRRGEQGFTAELRSLAHRLDEERGRRFQRGCAADLGDSACRVDLTAPAFRMVTRITGAPSLGACVTPAGGFASGWFTGGVLSVRSGVNDGAKLSVKSHRVSGAQAQIVFWTPPAAMFAVGDEVELVAGCDKSFAMCGVKFANRINFRGFPHIPGNDALLRYATSKDTGLDGGSLFQ